MRKHKRYAVILLAICLLFFIGCSKLTKENYDKIKIGMDHGEVTDILGNADECSVKIGVNSCIWGTESKHIKIDFILDKVVLFSNKDL